MTAMHLDRMTWAEVKAAIDNGRNTVVVPFGSTEQHGRHLPLGTDAVLGDELGWRLAERLDAFLAPTVRIGCSEQHLSFPGTISLREETFKQVVIDVVASLSRHGFRRIVLLPTHGGNFKPLAQAFAVLEPVEIVRVLAFTDLEGFVNVAFESSGSFGVTPAQSGAHSGEWETSAMLALRPEQVKMDQVAEGFMGELSEILAKVFDGIQNLDENGVLGDPRPATTAAGKKYIEDIVDFLYHWVRDQD
ncbi:MAG: creatininase family protein [Desulfobacterales bacterium]|nr:MAG: creatininase family protein [Desulfobacterales bacterium]